MDDTAVSAANSTTSASAKGPAVGATRARTRALIMIAVCAVVGYAIATLPSFLPPPPLPALQVTAPNGRMIVYAAKTRAQLVVLRGAEDRFDAAHGVLTVAGHEVVVPPDANVVAVSTSGTLTFSDKPVPRAALRQLAQARGSIDIAIDDWLKANGLGHVVR